MAICRNEFYKGKNQKPVKKLNAAFEIFDDATQRRQKMKKYNKTFEFPSSLQKMKKKLYDLEKIKYNKFVCEFFT